MRKAIASIALGTASLGLAACGGGSGRQPYFVGIDQGQVVVFQGGQSEPDVERRTDIDPSQLTQAQRQDLQAGKDFSSRSGADAYVRRLLRGLEERGAPTTTVPPPVQSQAPPS
jgi:hypothetical protein